MSNTQGLSSKVIVRDSGIHGKGITLLNYNFKSSGWYALEDIKKGEIIYTPHPNSDKFDFHLSEILTWPKERRRKFFRISYQVDDEIYNGYHSDTEISEEQKLDWHLVCFRKVISILIVVLQNHNCDPNVWYVKKDVVEARRDIKQGEELCYDYASTM